MGLAATTERAEAPEITLVVSDALRGLWAARSGKAPADTGRPVESLSASQAPDPRRPAPLQQGGSVRLRRDGGHPLKFEGFLLAALCHGEDVPDVGKVRLDLALYVDAGGGLVAATTARFPPDGPIRPIHLARPIADADDLRGLIVALGTCLRDALGGVGAKPRRDSLAMARRLAARLASGLATRSNHQENEEHHEHDD